MYSDEEMEVRGIQLLSNGAIRMSSVRTTDAGMYECVATSVAGNATKVIELIVQGMMKNNLYFTERAVKAFCLILYLNTH